MRQALQDALLTLIAVPPYFIGRLAGYAANLCEWMLAAARMGYHDARSEKKT